MTIQTFARGDVELLVSEAPKYLATVDAFRDEGCEPSWRPEQKTRTTNRRTRRISTPSVPDLGLDPG